MTTHPDPSAMSAWRSPWVRAWIGLLLTVLAVNLLMIYLAFATSPGLVVADYYERGRDYERTLVSRAARDPGWMLSADIPRPLTAGEKTTLRFFAVDRAGQPVELDEAHLHAYRPSDSARDFSRPMIREGVGRYAVEVEFPLIGAWDVLFAARVAGEESSHGERLMVARP